MAVPAHRTRKALQVQTQPTITLYQKVGAERNPGFSNRLPNWQRLERRDKENKDAARTRP